MIEFLAGAVTFAYGVAAVHFLRFWRRTSDRLFLHFALAFALFACNQAIVSFIGTADERSGYAYVLRVLGFILILWSIIEKNRQASRKAKK